MTAHTSFAFASGTSDGNLRPSMPNRSGLRPPQTIGVVVGRCAPARRAEQQPAASEVICIARKTSTIGRHLSAIEYASTFSQAIINDEILKPVLRFVAQRIGQEEMIQAFVSSSQCSTGDSGTTEARVAFEQTAALRSRKFLSRAENARHAN